MRKKCFLIAVFAVMVAISGCSVNTPNKTANITKFDGRYVSTQNIIEERYEIACIDDSGEDIYLAGASYVGGISGGAVLLKQAGTEFIPQSIALPESMRIADMIVISDKEIIFLLHERMEDENVHSQFVRYEDGKIDSTSDIFPVMYSKIDRVTDGFVASEDSRRISVFSEQFEEQRKIEPGNPFWHGICAMGNNIYYLDVESNALVATDVKSGKEQNRYVLPEAILGSGTMCTDDVSKILLFSDKGLWAFDASSEEWAELAAREEMFYFVPRGIPETNICANGPNTIYTCNIVYEDDGTYGYGLTAYEWQEINEENTTILRVLALRDYMHLRDQMLAYQAAHPDVMIEFIYYLESNDEPQHLWETYHKELYGALKERNIMTSDAKEKFNTELLAKGADIIFLDELDYTAYTQYCVDIQDLTAELGEEYFADIVNCYEKDDGSVPALATRFIAPVLIGDEEEISSIDNLSALVQYANNLPSHQLAYIPQNYYDDKDNWPLLMLANSTALMGEDSKLLSNSDAMKFALNDIYILGDHQSLHSNLAAKEGFANGSIRNYTEWLPSMSYYLPDEITDISARNENPYILPLPTINGAKTFWPKQIAGIYRGSKNPEAARGFIEHLLSYEAQSRDDWGDIFKSLPVRRDVLEAFMETVNIAAAENEAEAEAVYDERLKNNIIEAFSSLDTPIFYESGFYLAIYENILPYFEGDKTLDEAWAAVESKLGLMEME